MTLPGISVQIRDEAVSRFNAGDTAALFVVGFTERGPVGEPVAVHSLSDYVDDFGAKVSYGSLYDYLDVYFRNGGGLAFVQRVVGPNPAYATTNLFDTAGVVVPDDVSLVVTSKTPDEASNALSVEVTVSGTDFVLTVSDADGVVETSPALADRQAAVDWSETSGYIDVTLGTSAEDPRAQGPLALAGGTDDHASAVDAQWEDALAKVHRDFGPGQVAAPGRTTSAIHALLAAHAFANNRIALIDLPDTGVTADLVSAATTIRNLSSSRAAAIFAPWAVVGSDTPGASRLVPYSAIEAGLIARSEALGNTSNVPVAGNNGRPVYIQGLSQDPFTDDDREDLNEAGVNVAITKRGVIKTYGYRTTVDPDQDPEWRDLGGARVVMAIASESEVIAEDYVFSELDGQGITLGDFAGRLNALCLGYFNAGALFGASPEEAFFVDTGPTVNTPESIQDGKLLARIELATSPAAERVEITITKQG